MWTLGLLLTFSRTKNWVVGTTEHFLICFFHLPENVLLNAFIIKSTLYIFRLPSSISNCLIHRIQPAIFLPFRKQYRANFSRNLSNYRYALFMWGGGFMDPEARSMEGRWRVVIMPEWNPSLTQGCVIIRAQSLWRHIPNILCFQVTRFSKHFLKQCHFSELLFLPGKLFRINVSPILQGDVLSRCPMGY